MSLARIRALSSAESSIPAIADAAARLRTRHDVMTDRGRCRPDNEDSFLVDERLGLFLVCDGVGGRASGEVASAEAAGLIHERLLADLGGPGPTPLSAHLGALLRAAIVNASQTIHQLAMTHPRLAGMSTTASVVLITGDLAVIGQVGDSRVYHARGDVVRQLTEDHTLVNLQVQRGLLSRERARGRKSSITRALGLRGAVEVDIITAPLRPGDRLLLCTDGLSDYFAADGPDETDATLTRLMRLDLPDTALAAVRHANRCGGKDNITALFVDVLA